jgi:hypothetical protein
MLLQPKYALPSSSSRTSRSPTHKKENRPIKQVKKNSEGWLITPEGRILTPEKAAAGLVRLTHNITHLGKTFLQELLQKQLGNSNSAGQQGLPALCVQHNPGQGPRPPLQVQKRGVYPFQHLEINFTKIQQSKTYRYLLVVVCTFTGWVEAHPTHTEKATEVSRALTKEIIPWFRVPSNIGSDDGPAFVSQVIKEISHAVGLT